MAPRLDIDAGFQRQQWRLERVGWLLLGLALLAALAGAAGSGWLSWRTVTSPGAGLAVDYERVGHRQADAFATLLLQSTGESEVTVELSGDWVQAVDLRSISPEPVEQVAIPGGLRIVVAVGGTGETEVGISFRALRPGLFTAEVSARGESVSFRQLVLP